MYLLLFLVALGLRCCVRISPVAVSGLLTAVALEALERGLSSSGAPAYLACSRWDLPGPGREPVSPALAGGFLTTGPPVKSLRRFLTDLIVDSFFFFLNKTGHLYAVQPVEYN